jgi:hypothetical protein
MERFFYCTHNTAWLLFNVIKHLLFISTSSMIKMTELIEATFDIKFPNEKHGIERTLLNL